MRFRTAIVIALGAVLLATRAPVRAAETAAAGSSPRAVLARLLSSPHIAQDWLAPDFRAQIPAFKLERYIEQYRKELGPFDRVLSSGTNGQYLAVFAKGTLPALIVLDQRARVSELLFRVPKLYSLVGALRSLRALAGSIGYTVWKDGHEVAHAGQRAPLDAPSGLALVALAKLDGRIDRGRAHWDDVVRLAPGWKVAPSQVIGDWPNGAPLTIATLATLAIANGDRTAARGLAAFVGMPETHSYSNRALCHAMTRVQALPILAIDPGVAPRRGWSHRAYAGATRTDAITMTTWLARGPTTYCVSATWNPIPGPVDATLFTDDYFILLNSLEQP